MKFLRKSKVHSQISTASLPDIVFMLLFFFMVTTVLRNYSGLKVELPESESIVKIEGRSHSSYLWIDIAGNMSFDDFPVSPDDGTLYQAAYNRRSADLQLLMSLKYDKRVRMESISKANNELRKAGALRVNFAASVKPQ